MVKVNIGDKDLYVDGYLKENLDLLKQLVGKNWDGVGFICGYEGDGKTTLASQMCHYLDNTFNLDRVVFTPQEFLEAILNAKPHQAILFDEGYLVFNTRSWANKITNLLVSTLTTIRKKQLFILIVAPTFFDIQKFIVVHRSRFMIHVYAKGIERGYLRFFNRETKHQLYIQGKKFDNFYCVKPNFIGRFGKDFLLDEDEYDNKKTKSFEQFRQSLGKKSPQEIDPNLARNAQLHVVKWLKDRGLLQHGALQPLAEEYFNLSIGHQRVLLKNNDYNPYIVEKSTPQKGELLTTDLGNAEANQDA